MHTAFSSAFLACLIVNLGAANADENRPAVPEAIRPPADALPLFHVKASGYQIYRCEAGVRDTYHWALKAPDATLYDDDGNLFGAHFVGPTWQSNDGSHIVGKVEAKTVSPDNADAVAWLLVSVKEQGGNGVLTPVTHINRIATEGGSAPAEYCRVAEAGDAYRAVYSATYHFYGRKTRKGNARY